MSDMIDRAQRQSELILARELKKAQHHPTTTLSTAQCIDCDETIPELRRKQVAGCIRCVDCQSSFENSQKRAWRQ